MFSYSPWSHSLVPTTQFEQRALPINVTNRSQVTLTASFSRIVCVSASGSSATLGWTITNEAQPTHGVYNAAMLREDSKNGGPTSGRITKLGCKISNKTKALDIGGEVMVLKTHQRMDMGNDPASMTQAQVDQLIADIYAHPETRLISGHEFKKEQQFFALPRDHTDYVDYREWIGAETLDQAAGVATTRGTDDQPYPMEAIWLVFQQYGVPCSYQLSIDAAFYTRWPLDHHSSRSMIDIPTASPELLAQTQKKERR
jgi:hypothetical protein